MPRRRSHLDYRCSSVRNESSTMRSSNCSDGIVVQDKRFGVKAREVSQLERFVARLGQRDDGDCVPIVADLELAARLAKLFQRGALVHGGQSTTADTAGFLPAAGVD